MKIFSPFSGSLHVVYDFPTKRFIFVNRIGGIQYAMMLIFESYASKNILRYIAVISIQCVTTIITIMTEKHVGSSDGYTLITKIRCIR